MYEDKYHARWQLRAAFACVLRDDVVPEAAAYDHRVITTRAYLKYSRHVPLASASFGARFRDSLASYVVSMWERKLNVYFSYQDCPDRYPCHVDYMVDYVNAQYLLLESGSSPSLETYQDAMDRSAEAAARDRDYMSVEVEEYMDGGTASYTPAANPMSLRPLVGPDGIVQGSDADMCWEEWWNESTPVMHARLPLPRPDVPAVGGPVISGPDPRMAPHLRCVLPYSVLP